MSRSAPGGALRGVAKWGAEQALWARVRARSATGRTGAGRATPPAQPPTAVLDSVAEWQAACRDARRLGLPLHHDRTKNWDSLGALSVLLEHTPRSGAVLDAGGARYSTMLAWLRLYGYTDLWANNLEWSRPFRHGPVQFLPGDLTATDFPDGRFDGITCLSVVEHGVPVPAFVTEMHRLLKPGGVLVVSTDYAAQPPDTSGKYAYGQPVHIFDPAEIKDMVAEAESAGLSLLGELELDHSEQAVYWRRMDLRYTYIRLSFVKRATR